MQQKRALTLAQVKEAGFQLGDYSQNLPEGIWHGRLDFKKWGQCCLLCYFTDLQDGRKYRIAAFRNQDQIYSPRGGLIDFSYVDAGGIFQLETGRNSRGRPVWRSAAEVAA